MTSTKHCWATGMVALIGLALPASNTFAQSKEVSTAAEQEIMCQRVSDPPPGQVTFDLQAPQPYSAVEQACWVDWSKAEQLARQDAQWVDVREGGVVQQMRLPGTLAVPIQQVATHAALRGLDLLILGDDVDLRALSQKCVTWRQSGYFRDVYVVLGGVRSWRLAGKPILFDARALTFPEPPTIVTPAQFRRGWADGMWRVIALGLDGDQGSIETHPMLTIATADKDALENLRQALSQSDPDNSTRPWVVVTANASVQAKLQALWDQKQKSNPVITSDRQLRAQNQLFPQLLWLAGGLSGYQTWLDRQHQMAAHASHTLPRPCGV